MGETILVLGETILVLGETILVLGETICAKLVMGETRYNLSNHNQQETGYKKTSDKGIKSIKYQILMTDNLAGMYHWQ